MTASPAQPGERILHPCWSDGSALRLLDNGYAPLPIKPGTKAPILKRWQQFCAKAPAPATIEAWSRRFPSWGIGAATGQLVAIDIDLLDPAEAERMRDSAIEAFGDTPLVRIGSAPKVMLFYRAPEPFQHFRLGQSEVLSLGRQAVLFAIHPDTGQPYRWIDESPLDVPLSDLPEITEEAARDWLGPIRKGGRNHPLYPTITEQKGGEITPLYAGVRTIPKGCRNSTLFGVACRAAGRAPSVKVVLHEIQHLNLTECAPPLDEDEVRAIVASAWSYRINGAIWQDDGQAKATISAIELEDLVDTSGLPLLLLLRQKHGPRASGIIISPGAMADAGLIGRWQKKRYAEGRDILIEKGYVELQKAGTGRGNASLYRLTGPRRGAPLKGTVSTPYESIHPLSASLPSEERKSGNLESPPDLNNSAGEPVETDHGEESVDGDDRQLGLDLSTAQPGERAPLARMRGITTARLSDGRAVTSQPAEPAASAIVRRAS